MASLADPFGPNFFSQSMHQPSNALTIRATLLILLQQLMSSPARVLRVLALIPVMLLCFGLYLQHVVGLEPCPMCIVQRYVMLIMLCVALFFSVTQRAWLQRLGFLLYSLLGFGGAYVAARQSWLQWYPPEVVSCGRDFYGMIETFPLKRAIPMIFKGGGDCSAVDWTLFGGSIANWSFVAFTGLALIGLSCLMGLSVFYRLWTVKAQEEQSLEREDTASKT